MKPEPVAAQRATCLPKCGLIARYFSGIRTKPQEEVKKPVHHCRWGWFSKRAAPLVKISSGELAKYTEGYCANGGWVGDVFRVRRVKVLVRLSGRVLYMYVCTILWYPDPVDVVIPKLEGNYCPVPSVCKVKMNRQRRVKRESRYGKVRFYLEAYSLERTTGLIMIMTCYADPSYSRNFKDTRWDTAQRQGPTPKGTHCSYGCRAGSSIGCPRDRTSFLGMWRIEINSGSVRLRSFRTNFRRNYLLSFFESRDSKLLSRFHREEKFRKSRSIYNDV